MLTISEDDIMCDHLDSGSTDLANFGKREGNFSFCYHYSINTLKRYSIVTRSVNWMWKTGGCNFNFGRTYNFSVTLSFPLNFRKLSKLIQINQLSRVDWYTSLLMTWAGFMPTACISTGRYLTLVRKILGTSDQTGCAREGYSPKWPSKRSESGRRCFLYTAVSEYNGFPSIVYHLNLVARVVQGSDGVCESTCGRETLQLRPPAGPWRLCDVFLCSLCRRRCVLIVFIYDISHVHLHHDSDSTRNNLRFRRTCVMQWNTNTYKYKLQITIHDDRLTRHLLLANGPRSSECEIGFVSLSEFFLHCLNRMKIA